MSLDINGSNFYNAFYVQVVAASPPPVGPIAVGVRVNRDRQTIEWGNTTQHGSIIRYDKLEITPREIRAHTDAKIYVFTIMTREIWDHQVSERVIAPPPLTSDEQVQAFYLNKLMIGY